jgi:hypothetical protein
MERVKRVHRAPKAGLVPEPEESPEGRDRSEGARNKVTTSVLIAMMLAAEQVGEDGHGRNGIVGYFCQIARSDPQFFFRMLVRVWLDQKVDEDDKAPLDTEYQTVEEAKAALREVGIDIDSVLR